MTVPQRLLGVPLLAGVMYLSVVVAGMAGFDPTIWVLYTLLFLVWHLLMHQQQVALWLVVPVHAAVAAAFLGLGVLIGGWVGAAAPPPLAALGVGVAATALARLVRLPPEEAAAIAALADEARAKIEADAPQTNTPPQDTQPPDRTHTAPDADAQDDDAQDAEIAHALNALFLRLDALSATEARHHDLVDAITPAIGPVPVRELISALFARARATSRPRDLRAVTVLLTDPHVAGQSVGQGDLEAAFHLIRASGDGGALAHWAMQTEAVLDFVPDLWPDLPENETLAEAAAAAPEARDILRALGSGRPGQPESPAP